MKKHIYRVVNIESSNFSFNDKERKIFDADIRHSHSGRSYYQIEATWFQYLRLRIRFWVMRHRIGSKVRIVKT